MTQINAPLSELSHLIGCLFVIVVAMAQNSDLPGELFEVGIAVFVIAILFGLTELFFRYT